jgi:hypothetical protein
VIFLSSLLCSIALTAIKGVNGTGTNLNNKTTEKLMMLNQRKSNQKKRNIFCSAVLFLTGFFVAGFFFATGVTFFAILY